MTNQERPDLVVEDDFSHKEIVKTLLNSQAELQSALGVYRLSREWADFDPYIEKRMQASLAMQHQLLDSLGHPMGQPTQMPEGWTPA